MWQIPEDILQRNDDEKSLNFVLDQLKNPQMFISKVQELYKTDRKDFDILAFKDGRVFERYSEPDRSRIDAHISRVKAAQNRRPT